MIHEAQLARGLPVNGPVWKRAGMVLALVIPLVVTLLRDATVRAEIRYQLRASEAAFNSGGDVAVWSRRELWWVVASCVAVTALSRAFQL
jgi:energy-coupling factor transporter transmembrane protein EcfT